MHGSMRRREETGVQSAMPCERWRLPPTLHQARRQRRARRTAHRHTPAAVGRDACAEDVRQRRAAALTESPATASRSASALPLHPGEASAGDGRTHTIEPRPKRERRPSRPLSWRRGTVASLWADPCRVLLSPAAGRLTAGRRGPAGRSFVVLSGRRGQRSAFSSAAAPRSAQSASGMPTLIAEETKRADLTQLRELDRRYAVAEPTLRLDAPFSSHATSSAGKSAPGRGSRHRLVLRAGLPRARGPPPVRRCRGVGE
jgi:hypothetical protein